jgi:glutamine synthetase
LVPTSFAERCNASTPAREASVRELSERLSDGSIQRVRLAWSDLHGVTRCKTLLAPAAIRALQNGIGMVSTLLLKDTSDRTALPVFGTEAARDLPRFANAPNLTLLPDPSTFVTLPWSVGTGWMLGDSFHADASPCAADPRRVLAAQVERLRGTGYRLRCGLEIEFHVYRLLADSARLDPEAAGWPGPAPRVEMLHPGYRLLSEDSADASHEFWKRSNAWRSAWVCRCCRSRSSSDRVNTRPFSTSWTSKWQRTAWSCSARRFARRWPARATG